MAGLNDLENEYRKQHPEATDIYKDADVPGAVGGVISNIGSTLSNAGDSFKAAVTPPGGFKEGASTSYHIGEGIEQGATGFVQAAGDVGSTVYNNIPTARMAEGAADVYKGVMGLDPNRGILEQALERWDGGAAPAAQPAPATKAAPAKAPTKVAGQSAAPRAGGPAPRKLLNNPWQQGGVPMRALQGGIYASGQDLPEGESPYYEWSRTTNGQIEKVMLPAGVDPTKLSGEQMAAFKPYIENPADTGEGVRVVRGLREFKGGKEVEDGRTAELRTKDMIRMMSQEMDSAANPVGRQQGFTGERIPTDPAAMQGVVSEMLQGQSQERQQEIASASQERQQKTAAGAAITAAKIGAGKAAGAVDESTIKWRDMYGNETSVPVIRDRATGITQYMLPGMPIIDTPSGLIIPPYIAKDPALKRAYIETAAKLRRKVLGEEETSEK
jgi:hypothetical protein